MASIPTGSKSFQDKNPHLFKRGNFTEPSNPPTEKGEEIVTNFVLQKSTDVQKLNKLEGAFWSNLQMLNYAWIGCQNITLKIGFDTRYTPDFSAIGFNGEFIFFETKSAFFRDDAKVKIKVAAGMFRWAQFQVVRKEKSGWSYEIIKP